MTLCLSVNTVAKMFLQLKLFLGVMSYELASRLKINFNKSKLAALNVGKNMSNVKLRL